MNPSVLLEIKNQVAYIALNRPESRNAFDLELAQGLNQALSCCFEPEIRAVVLTGVGQAFCVGGDLRTMSQAPSLSQALGQLTLGLNRAVLDIRLLGKAVLAAVNGAAAGAGMSLALACDIRLLAEQAKFKQAYTSSGLVPDGGWTLLAPALLGQAKATELLLLDPLLSAEAALALGLGLEIVPQAQLLARAGQLAEGFAQGSLPAYAAAKALVNQSLLPALSAQVELERQAMIKIGAGADAREGVAAFLAKRQPIFGKD